MLVIERCHLRVEAMVATPYAAGLSTLVDDEAELGAAVVDFGGGSTTVGVFSGGRLIHVDAVALGGIHVTRDVARGLNVSVSDAERLKTLYGACIASPSDDRETIAVHRLGDDPDHPSHLPKSELVQIIRPRVEEILELVRDRLKASGHAAHAGRRLVMTGAPASDRAAGAGALDPFQPGAHRAPARDRGAAGIRQEPSFAAAVGLMVYPQMAGLEYSKSPARSRAPSRPSRLCGAGRTVAKGEFLRRVKRRSPEASAWVKAKHAFQSAPAGVQPMRQACRSI